MGRTKDEYRRRISLLKRLRVILLAVAVVLAVCAAVTAWMGRAADDPKPTFPSIPQTVPETTQSPSIPIITKPAEPTESTGSEDNNPSRPTEAIKGTEPKEDTGEEPEHSTDEEPKASTDENPGASIDENPEASTDEEPEVSDDEEPKASTDEDPEASADEEPKDLATETTGPAQEEPVATTEPSAPKDHSSIFGQEELPTQNTDNASAEFLPTGPAETTPSDAPGSKTDLRSILLVVMLVLLAADLAAVAVVSVCIRKVEKEYKAMVGATRQKTVERMSDALAQLAGEVRVGALHNIGARPYQEDSLGTSTLDDGVLAVVADGMGGLSGGDKVSQTIVRTMLQQASRLRPGQMEGVLEHMLGTVNQEVNQMLGPDGIYKSGSTLLAVLLRKDRFHWLTVGDSRIYLYHKGQLTQLNQEHNRGQEQIIRAVCGEISFQEARGTSKKSNVTSFIGMGKLKYVERSVRPIPLEPGDRVLLMTDGVFNTLTDRGIASVLAGYPDVQAAADELERLVVQYGSSRQDNFSAIILGF